MTVVVQQTLTRLFVGKAGGWVKNVSDARDFRRAADATAFCDVEHLAHVRVGILSDAPAETVYFRPESSRHEIRKARNLRRKNRELRAKQQLLVAEIQAVQSKIAQQSAALPMPRKMKRQHNGE